jgi:hypothetical protein
MDRDPSTVEDDEYEVEPPDAEVLERQRRETQVEVTRAGEAAKVQQLEDEMHSRADVDFDFSGWRFQFTTRHLLILMTVVAVAISIAKVVPVGAIFAFLVMGLLVFLIGIHSYLAYQENRRLEELSARRKKLVAQARGQSMYDAPLEDAALAEGGEPVESFVRQLTSRPPWRLQFSMRELMIGMTIAAVACGLFQIVPPVAVASTLGLLTVAGVFLYVAGYQPPAPILAGWWIMLGLYVLTSVASVLWN